LKFKFDLNSNSFAIYKTYLKKKKILIGNWLRAEFSAAQPPSSREHGLRGPADSRARTM
jgi:hypothetical protein